MFPVIHLDGQPYLDGGCADAIPWRHALEAGCDRVVVILTRERSYSKGPSSVQQRLLARRFRRYPKFVETMARRAEAYNQSRRDLFRHGGLRQGSDPGAGEHRRIFPHGAGRGEDPRPVAVRLLRGAPGTGRRACLLDGGMIRFCPGLSPEWAGCRFSPRGHGFFPQFTDTYNKFCYFRHFPLPRPLFCIYNSDVS